MILSSFPVGAADRASVSSKTIGAYAVLDLKALLAGKLQGRYMTSALPYFETLSATRIQKYPQIIAVAKASISASAVWGTYEIVGSVKWKGWVLVFDVLAGTPVVNFTHISDRMGFHLVVGPPWDGSGVFSLASPEGSSGEPDDRKLYYIRGHFLDERHMEFYLVTPTHGLEGPLQAVRK